MQHIIPSECIRAFAILTSTDKPNQNMDNAISDIPISVGRYISIDIRIYLVIYTILSKFPGFRPTNSEIKLFSYIGLFTFVVACLTQSQEDYYAIE